MTFAQVRAGLAEGAPLWVVGANQAGIKGAKSVLADVIGSTQLQPVRKIDAARRCTLLSVTVDVPMPFRPDDWTLQWTAQVKEQSIRVESWPGTFSDGALDEGTAELLDVLYDRPLGARILDMACGSGVIGAMLAKYRPESEVVLVDTQAAAVMASRATCAHNMLTNTQVGPSYWYSDVSGKFDAIVCNPPFHQGVRTDRTMADEVIGPAPAYLETGASVWLVANRFLPYLDRLQATFRSVTIVKETPRFRVYRARSPQPSRSGSERKR